jgi:chemotaxis protein CheD
MGIELLRPLPGGRVLHPGDVAAGGCGDRFETLLGSCVTIILIDPRRTQAALCHVVHAGVPAGGGADASTAYGEAALAAMARLLRERGFALAQCEAYLMGGGNMFPGQNPSPHVGDRNTLWALDALAREGITVTQRDTGGAGYRRLSWTVGPSLPQATFVPV